MLINKETKHIQYSPTNAEKKVLDFVSQRFNDMKTSRQVVDKDRWLYQEMINAVYEPYPDERSSSTVPLASSLIELYVAEASKMQTEYTFKSETEKENNNAKILEYVWEYDFRKNNRKKEFIGNEYTTAAFWTSVIYTWYESYNKTQFDPIMNDEWQVEFIETQIDKSKIIVKNVDIRQFFIDNQAIEGIEDATDCIFVQRMWVDKFNNFKSNPLYKNIDKVNPSWYSNENKSFTTEEEKSKTWDYVKVMHYWNVEKDEYVVIANDVLVRQHPMISTIDWEKALPFVIRVLAKKNYSIYGRWICEALVMFNSEVNNLREMLMDWIRRSNSQILALWNWLNFNWRDFSYDNEILTFDWNLWDSFQQISGNPPNQAIFSYIDKLYKDIAVYVWLDIQNIIWEPQQTAFQTEVQREASQKRVNVWLTNRDLAFERFANLYKDLLQTFFPKKTAKWLYPEIEIEWEKLVGNGETKRFKKSNWKSILEITPDSLRWQINIDVHTNTTAPTINAVDKQQKLDFMNAVWWIWQWYMLAQQAGIDMESILPMKQTMKELASDFNLQPTSWEDNHDVEDAKAKLMGELQSMQQQPETGEQVQQQVEWWEQPLQTNPEQWQSQQNM